VNRSRAIRGGRLWRLLDDQRIVVGLGVVVAVAAAAFAVVGLPRSSGPPAANAAAQVLLDTNRSQLITAASREAINLPMRATLVGDLVASDRLTGMVARDAHIPQSELTIIPPSSLEPPAVLSPLVTKAAPFAASATTPYVVLLNTNEGNVTQAFPMPIISIETQAPDLAAATTLVDAAISGLKSALAPQGGGRASPFVVRTVSPARMIVIPHKSRRAVYAVVGGLVIFMLWYGAAMLGGGIARRLRPAQLA
jgi:hypothetical protein